MGVCIPLSIHVISLFLVSCSTESTPVYTLTTTANPAEGWLFSRWEQDLKTTANPLSIAMLRDWEALVLNKNKLVLNKNKTVKDEKTSN